MFPKKYRLPLPQKRNKLRNVFSGEYFYLKAADNGAGHNRFALVISARAAKKSVARHFWKRRLSELLKRWPNFQKDFLFIFSPKMENASEEKMKTEIYRSLKVLNSEMALKQKIIT